MALTRAEQERVNDSKLKIQAIAESLKKVDPKEIPAIENIEDCLEDAERNLERALHGQKREN